MSIEIERDIDGDAQEASFRNATLQAGPPGYEFSISIHLDVPLIGVYDQDTLANFVKHTFAPISDNPRVHVQVQMGREGGGERWYLMGLQACAFEELPRRHEHVEVILEPGLDSQGFNTVTLVAEKPAWIMQFVQEHWGGGDEDWLLCLEDQIEWGEVPTYA